MATWSRPPKLSPICFGHLLYHDGSKDVSGVDILVVVKSTNAADPNPNQDQLQTSNEPTSADLDRSCSCQVGFEWKSIVTTSTPLGLVVL